MKVRELTGVALFMIIQTVYSYRPDEGAMEFRMSIGPAYHTSSISKAEEDFSDYFGFYFILTDTATGTIDTIVFDYSFLDVQIEGTIFYYPREGIGIGLSYQYGRMNQSIDTKKYINEPAEEMLRNHKVGPLISFWGKGSLLEFINASISLGVNLNFGRLNRFALLKENYNNNDALYALIARANETVKCFGFGVSPRLSLYLFAGEHLAVFVTGRYDLVISWIRDDVFDDYPNPSVSHEFGALFGIEFITISR